MPSDIRTVYKVCRVNNKGKNISFWPGIPKKMKKEYSIGEKTVPDFGKLYAFEKLADARNAAYELTNGIIFECKASVSKYAPRLEDTTETYTRIFIEFWDNYLKKHIDYVGYNARMRYSGTILCNWIIPKKIIE